jgi:hypothetical protein
MATDAQSKRQCFPLLFNIIYTQRVQCPKGMGHTGVTGGKERRGEGYCPVILLRHYNVPNVGHFNILHLS